MTSDNVDDGIMTSHNVDDGIMTSDNVDDGKIAFVGFSLTTAVADSPYCRISDCKLISSMHCKPGEAYTRLITASCEAGPGTMHMWILEICIWSLQILEIAARYVFNNSLFGLSKCYLYI